MVTVQFIRHAQSTANAGGHSSDPATIPLTALGHAQAKEMAAKLQGVSDLIVCSPYLRTQQTAAPLLTRFPAAPCVIWPIEEFTYLSPERCVNTTAEQRRPWAESYWQNADPYSVDGRGAESFGAFIGRARSALDRFAGLPVQTVIVFGHGQFLQALHLLVTKRLIDLSMETMREFREVDLANPIFHCNGFSAYWNGITWELQ